MYLLCAQYGWRRLGLCLGCASKNDCAGSQARNSPRPKFLSVRRQSSNADWLHHFLLGHFLVLIENWGTKLETQTRLRSVLFLVSWNPSLSASLQLPWLQSQGATRLLCLHLHIVSLDTATFESRLVTNPITKSGLKGPIGYSFSSMPPPESDRLGVSDCHEDERDHQDPREVC